MERCGQRASSKTKNEARQDKHTGQMGADEGRALHPEMSTEVVKAGLPTLDRDPRN